MQAFTTLAFADSPEAIGRKKWTAVFTFDNLTGQAASNAQLAYSSGIPSITFANVGAGAVTPAAPCLLRFVASRVHCTMKLHSVSRAGQPPIAVSLTT